MTEQMLGGHLLRQYLHNLHNFFNDLTVLTLPPYSISYTKDDRCLLSSGLHSQARIPYPNRAQAERGSNDASRPTSCYRRMCRSRQPSPSTTASNAASAVFPLTLTKASATASGASDGSGTANRFPTIIQPSRWRSRVALRASFVPHGARY